MIKHKNKRGSGKKRISRLSLKFVSIVILAAVISGSMFGLLFFNRYRIFHLVVGEKAVQKETDEQIRTLQKTITEKSISKKNRKAIKREMNKYKDLTLYLYDDEDTLSETSFSAMEDQAYVGTMSFWLNLYEPDNLEYTLTFSDGESYLIVYSFLGLSFMLRYLIAAGVVSILTFILIIMQFVHRKMKYVLSIEEEMQLIESGDFHHTIIYKGNDELTDLARQLNHLRNALYDNMLKEEEARNVNHELVTAMSHDLRTPLTSLLGYLDILEMKIYKSDEAMDDYIHKSRQKAQQIKDMSDKLFNHFLVFSRDEELQLHPIADDIVLNMLEFYSEELREQGFDVLTKFEKESWKIMGEEAMLQRVFDNVFSNIRKYAGKQVVTISLQVEKGSVLIRLKNRKKKDASREESTQIGLKSVNKIMKSMNGSFLYENDDTEFVVELFFPCRQEGTGR
ncbi:HAMP domain-containing histidine kinase [[Clostridium] innocuum]|nr:HAMP domain-containing histidine kinase [[Clostridium] innocuum]